MKLKNTFKLIGLSLFFVALMLFIMSQDNKISFADIMFPFAFGVLLTLSGGALITGELIGKIDSLEKKTKQLEEELLKLKDNSENKE